MVEGFHDVRFPLSIALGSRGGPERRTEIVTLASGHETRRARWSQSRRRYNAGYGIKDHADIEALVAFFEARQGRRYAFRWRDPFDFRSAIAGEVITPNDQVLGVADGTRTIFPLVKRYSSGDASAIRTVTHPVEGTVVVSIDGSELDLGTEYTVDHLKGEVTLASSPAAGAVVSAGFEFDVPVRFDTDQLSISISATGGNAPDIPIVEVRPA
ncbi:MAG: DUF2460 domain-containing protein [Pseudomonadota bacterium]